MFNLNKNNYKSGMSLVEMVVLLSIFTILSLVILNSIASFYRYNAYTIAQSYQVSNARRGVELLVRDMREMIYADDGSFPLVNMSTSSISFYSDIDRDDSVEFVDYQLIGTTLYKYVYDAVGSPPSYSTTTPSEVYTLSEYVQNNNQDVDIFTYYAIDGDEANATTTVTDIRYINVEVIVNIDPVRDPGEFSLRSSASLRNLKENL